MNLAKSNNKILKIGEKLLDIPYFFEIKLEVSGTSFPDTVEYAPFKVASSVAGNTMYIDANDGLGYREFAPTSGNNHFYGNLYGKPIVLYFQDVPEEIRNTVTPSYATRRIIKIKFKYPSAITGIAFQQLRVFGEMPMQFGLYNLTSEFTISAGNNGNARWESFPSNLRGIKTNTLSLTGAFKTKLNYFPSWIGNSQITVLRIQDCLNLSADASTTGINVISNVVGLVTLYIGINNMGNNSFPTTLKNISTLKILYIANPFTQLPTAVAECSQVESLTVSNADGNGYADSMNNWGVGLGLMTSLKTLIYIGVGIGATILETNLPTGLENCTNLKTVAFNATFKTQATMDAHINNWYDFIVANASTMAGNTKFRNMTFDVSLNVGSYQSLRPSGGATPTAVITPPTTPIEKIYNLCKLYGHTWKIKNLANSAVETITPTS